MPECEDQQLLAEFAGDNSEAAFAALVSRYVNLVYSAALRFTGSPDAAEEITQVVFIILARKAGSLRRGTVLSGWLYQTARLTAANFVKRETRRRRREQEAFMQSTMTNEPESAWEQMAPLLEEAMGGLGETDRNAVVLRFFENKTAREVAVALKMKEEAAHKRVNRALEKLRKFFMECGVSSTTATIAETISTHSVQAAPEALTKLVTAVAIAKGAAASSTALTLSKGALKIMAWTKTTTTVAAGVIILLAAGTTTVMVEKYKAYQKNLNSWRIPRFGPNTVSDAVPQARILRTKFRAPVYGYFWAPPDKWAGVNLSVTDLAQIAYRWGPGRIYFPDGEPTGGYDFAVTLPKGNLEALQEQIQKTFGLVGHPETMDTNVLMLVIRNPNAPGLKPHSGPTRGSLNVLGYITCKGLPFGIDPPDQAFGFARYLEMFVHVPVIDETGLDSNYDINIHWNEKGDTDHEALKKVLLDKLGLELVPTNMPVEMLVMEKAQ